MGGNNEQWVSTGTLYAAVTDLQSKLDRMTEQCEKLLAHNSDLIAERNQLQATANHLNTVIDKVQTENALLRDANRSLVVAVTETAGRV